jgi:hypothetical protein
MPRLVLGPLLRYVGPTEATVWVETDAPCEVEVLGSSSATFQVAGHHYALVHVTGLAEDACTPYAVHLDGERHWPLEDSDWPDSVIRTLDSGAPVELLFGSCRVTLPHTKPYTCDPDEDERGRGYDALVAIAHRMRKQRPEDRPHKLLMLGDQVYVDEGSPEARERIQARRDVDRPPGREVADFEEYTWLYHEAWSDPAMRWLLSTVATGMVWDDHDMHDDWNISESWVRDMRKEDWWQQRVCAGVMSYWLYQHIGNLAPAELDRDETLARVREAGSGGGDAEPVLRELAHHAEHHAEGTQWSYCRDTHDIRVLVIDSRAGRVLGDARHAHHHERAMVDDHEWEWIADHATGDVEHLVIATSVPFLMLPGLHYLEQFSEALCDGVHGRIAARVGERLRRALDLEHWPAFDDSFQRLAKLIEEVASGRRGRPPASIVVLSGDVHHAYFAQAALPRSAGARSAVYQAVCSPFRNDLNRQERAVLRFWATRAGHAIGRALARTAGIEDPPLRWRIRSGPWFQNQVATLRLNGSAATMRLEKTIPGDPHPDLERCFEEELSH